MLKYLIVQLDDTSVSFCHYRNDRKQLRLIEYNVLKDALFWSMKENLTVQFLYPDYELPVEYKALIMEMDHADVVSSNIQDEDLRKQADVVVFDSWEAINRYSLSKEQAYVIRTSFSELFAGEEVLCGILPMVSRLNVVIIDVENLDKAAQNKYSQFLENINQKIYLEYKNNHGVQINILTDRMMLDAMNNCGARDETITLAPDGKFYICPGFYLDSSDDVGNVEGSLDIKNPQLYRLGYAPICRVCDAWQCKRCIWQNKKMTLEVNTPGREQCVMAHIERNASRRLLAKIREIGTFLPNKEISEITYLDPFDKLQEKE